MLDKNKYKILKASKSQVSLHHIDEYKRRLRNL